MEKIPMTEVGFVRLEKELKNLKSVERPAIIAAISEARAHGDLSENAEYHAAKEKQSFIEGRIMELEAIISRAEVIDVTEHAAEHIKFGATVTLIDEETEEEISYQIVGDYEADITRGLISNSAPIGRALIGKQEGTSVEVTTPKGVRYYEVIKVEYK
jgi:transcription elongation factor GreA